MNASGVSAEDFPSFLPPLEDIPSKPILCASDASVSYCLLSIKQQWYQHWVVRPFVLFLWDAASVCIKYFWRALIRPVAKCKLYFSTTNLIRCKIRPTCTWLKNIFIKIENKQSKRFSIISMSLNENISSSNSSWSSDDSKELPFMISL